MARAGRSALAVSLRERDAVPPGGAMPHALPATNACMPFGVASAGTPLVFVHILYQHLQ
jgi:hypothetical protein